MSVFEALRTALGMIRAHKLRAFFTVLGTVVGVTFLIAVITLITGMDRYMKEDFAGTVYGVNTVQLRKRPSVLINPSREQMRAWRRRPDLTFEDAAWLARRMETPGVLALSADRNGRVGGPRGRAVEGVSITGASASFFQIRELGIADGRAFSEHEAERGTPVVVLGTDVAERLFEGLNPLGQTVRIDNFPYTVVGVLEKQGSLFGMSLDNVVVAPIKSPLNGYVNSYNRVEEISYKVPDARLLPTAMAEVEGWMRIRHRLHPGEQNDFEVETSEAALGFWTKVSQIMLVALPGLVAISLLVGAVVIMNIMLVSVTDRTREIGLRKSLGARRRDILWQFLIEAGTLSGAGGLLGIGIGIALAALVSSISPIPAQVAPWSIGLAIALGAGVGLAAGVYPAYRASRLDPIVALRHE
ncbi:MAG TPA: ABC transporter permease [Longimicrobiaceae bacterium]|jgi:putative ABC transport system permease protein|nr:ABC transporter permease [Longimicrobiaceae bacterium]